MVHHPFFSLPVQDTQRHYFFELGNKNLRQNSSTHEEHKSKKRTTLLLMHIEIKHHKDKTIKLVFFTSALSALIAHFCFFLLFLFSSLALILSGLRLTCCPRLAARVALPTRLTLARTLASRTDKDNSVFSFAALFANVRCLLAVLFLADMVMTDTARALGSSLDAVVALRRRRVDNLSVLAIGTENLDSTATFALGEAVVDELLRKKHAEVLECDVGIGDVETLVEVPSVRDRDIEEVQEDGHDVALGLAPKSQPTSVLIRQIDTSHRLVVIGKRFRLFNNDTLIGANTARHFAGPHPLDRHIAFDDRRGRGQVGFGSRRVGVNESDQVADEEALAPNKTVFCWDDTDKRFRIEAAIRSSRTHSKTFVYVEKIDEEGWACVEGIGRDSAPNISIGLDKPNNNVVRQALIIKKKKKEEN